MRYNKPDSACSPILIRIARAALMSSIFFSIFVTTHTITKAQAVPDPLLITTETVVTAETIPPETPVPVVDTSVITADPTPVLSVEPPASTPELPIASPDPLPSVVAPSPGNVPEVVPTSPVAPSTVVLLADESPSTVTATMPLEVGQVELEEFRTERSKVYISPNGEEQTDNYPFPIHFRNELGKWEDIDARFYKQADGSLKSGRGNINAILRQNPYNLVSISKYGLSCSYYIGLIRIGDIEYRPDVYSMPNWQYVINSDNGIYAEMPGAAIWNDIIPGVSLILSITNTDFYTELVTNDHTRLPSQVDFVLNGCGSDFFTSPTMSDADTGGIQLTSSYSNGILSLTPQYQDLGSLNGEVRIDPSVNAGLAVSVFTSQGYPNGHVRRFDLAAPNFVDTTTGTWAGRAETYLLFDIHGAIWDRGNTGQAYVTGANLRLRHYTNNGPAFTMYAGRLLQGINGSVGAGVNQWMARTGAYVGAGIIKGYFPNKTDINLDVTGIVRDIWGGQPNYGIAVWGEGGGYASGSAFCSGRADTFCAAWEAPVLTINSFGNYRPFQPGIVAPTNNAVLTGNCDKSTTTGLCYSGTAPVNVHVNNIGDSDFNWPANYSHSVVYYSSTSFDANGVSGTFASGDIVVYPNYGDVHYQWSAGSNTTMNIQQGVVSLRAISVDAWGQTSVAWTYTNFVNDYTPPATPSLSALPLYMNERGMRVPVMKLVIDNVTAKGEVSYQFELTNILTGAKTISVWIRPATNANELAFELGIGGMDGLLGTADDLTLDGIYSVRVKARDNYNNVSFWSTEKQFALDLTAPVIQSLSLAGRFSPRNGRTSLVQLSSIDTNFSHAIMYLKGLDGKKYYFSANDTYITQSISINWDGTVYEKYADGSYSVGQILSDGIYVLEYEVYDLADHSLLSSNLAAYNQDPANFANYFIVIDTEAPTVSVTQPYDNYWTSANSVPVSGQVSSQDAATLELRITAVSGVTKIYTCVETLVALGNAIGCNINPDTHIFVANVEFDTDSSTLYILATDSVGNETVVSYLLRKDTVAPTLTMGMIDGTSGSSFRSSTPRVDFTLEEMGDSGTVSGLLASGAYTPNVSVTLVYTIQSPDGPVTVRKPLFQNGVRLDDLLTTQITCIPNSDVIIRNAYEAYTKLTCYFNLTAGLPHNATVYGFEITSGDVAGNSAMAIISGKYDSMVYASLTQPTFGGVYARSRIIVEITASRGSTVTIRHLPSGSEISLFMHESLNGQEVGGLLGGTLDVDCSQYADHDNDVATAPEQVCHLSSRIQTSYADNWDPLSNTIELVVVDEIGNSETRQTEFIISPSNFSIIIAPDYGFLSPNGDGVQDVLQITHRAVNPDNDDPFAQPEVAGYEWKLTNATALIINNQNIVVGTVLRIISANSPLPFSTIFDGYICIRIDGSIDQTMESCLSGDATSVYIPLPDATYTHRLTVITFEGARVTSGEMPLMVRSTSTDTITLTAPLQVTTTTSGAVLVSGIGPRLIGRELTSSLRGMITIIVCVDIDEQTSDIPCNSRTNVTPNSSGVFSTIVTLPAPRTINQTYRISAYAVDEFGVRTPSSQTVAISYDRRDAIIGVAMDPGISGVSTTTLWNNYLNTTKTTNIEQIAYQLVSVTVSQGTEVVYLRYADSVTPVAIANGTLNFRDIGVYGAQTETALKNNPRAIQSVKKKIAQNLSAYTFNGATVCLETTCIWSMYIPIAPTSLAGQYALEVTAKKGDSLSTQQVYYQVYNQALTEPVFVLIDSKNRVIGYENYNVNVALMPTGYGLTASQKTFSSFTTNASQVIIRGSGVAGKKLKITATAEGRIFVLCASVTVSATGTFSCTANLAPALTTLTGIASNANFLYPDTLRVFDISAETIPATTTEAIVYSKNIFRLSYDTRAPKITDVRVDTVTPNLPADNGNAFASNTRTTTGPLNGWVAPGGYADYYITTANPVRYIDIVKESGYTVKMFDLGNNQYKVRIIIDRILAGYYAPSFTMVDYAGNVTTVRIVGNTLTTTEIIPGRTLTTVYNLNTAQATTNFGYFVSPNGTRVGDLRVYEDDALTDPTEFAINGELRSDYVYGDGLDGIFADAVSPEVNRLAQGYVTRAPSVVLMGVAEEGTRVEIWMSKFGTAGQSRIAVLQVGLNGYPGLKCYGLMPSIFAGDASLGAPVRVFANGTIASVGQMVTKSGQYCEWSYEFVFPDDGSNDAFGIPLHGYTFTARVVDHTGLATVHSTERSIWHDTAAPLIPVFASQPTITNQPIYETFSNAERSSDLIVELSRVINNSGSNTMQDFDLAYTRASDTSATKLAFTLGQSVADGVNCYAQSDIYRYRRVGTCNDGYYMIRMNSTDSAGNVSITSQYILERDTVGPFAPSIRLQFAGNHQLRKYYVYSEVVGEAYTRSQLAGYLNETGYAAGVLYTLDPTNPSLWSTTLRVCDRLIDDATNYGDEACAFVVTPIMPPGVGECTAVLGQMYNAVFQALIDGTSNAQQLAQAKAMYPASCKYWEGDHTNEVVASAQADAENYNTYKTTYQQLNSCIQASSESSYSLRFAQCGGLTPNQAGLTEIMTCTIDPPIELAFNPPAEYGCKVSVPETALKTATPLQLANYQTYNEQNQMYTYGTCVQDYFNTSGPVSSEYLYNKCGDILKGTVAAFATKEMFASQIYPQYSEQHQMANHIYNCNSNTGVNKRWWQTKYDSTGQECIGGGSINSIAPSIGGALVAAGCAVGTAVTAGGSSPATLPCIAWGLGATFAIQATLTGYDVIVQQQTLATSLRTQFCGSSQSNATGCVLNITLNYAPDLVLPGIGGALAGTAIGQAARTIKTTVQATLREVVSSTAQKVIVSELTQKFLQRAGLGLVELGQDGFVRLVRKESGVVLMSNLNATMTQALEVTAVTSSSNIDNISLRSAIKSPLSRLNGYIDNYIQGAINSSLYKSQGSAKFIQRIHAIELRKALANTTKIIDNATYVFNEVGTAKRMTVIDLQLGSNTINSYTRTIARAMGLSVDDAGHLCGKQFNCGFDELFNLVPQNSALNRSLVTDTQGWRSMEESWVTAINNGIKVNIDMEMIYDVANPYRPTGFKVSYTLDGGVPIVKSFVNL